MIVGAKKQGFWTEPSMFLFAPPITTYAILGKLCDLFTPFYYL